MNKAQTIKAMFEQHGPMTILRCKELTGWHQESIRRVVRPPVYRQVGTVARPHQDAVVWALAKKGETLTAIDDGGTVHRRDGSDPWLGVCVAEAG